MLVLVSLLAGCGDDTLHQRKENTTEINSGVAVQGSKDDMQSVVGKKEEIQSTIVMDESVDEGDLVVFWTDTETLFAPGDAELIAVNTQFYQGEQVRIWSRRKDDGVNPITLDIYLYRENGSSELLASDVSTKYRSGWFLDEGGNYYITSGSNIIRLKEDGSELYITSVGGKVSDISELSDGTMIVLLRTDEGKMKVAELEPESGAVTVRNNIALKEDSTQFIGGHGENILVLNKEGVWEFDRLKGAKTCLISFEQYPYEVDSDIRDFRVTEDGSVEILFRNTKEVLQLVNISKTREILVLQGDGHDDVLERFVEMFNKTNSKYYISYQPWDESSDYMDYIQRINIEIGTGSGADILDSSVIDNPLSFLEKGVFENLLPYMKQYGIQEEDYFPAAFSTWRQAEPVYAVSFYTKPWGVQMSFSSLLNEKEINIEILTEALLDYKGEEVFRKTCSNDWVLDYFLSGSESLWGMVDWENKCCDFSGELFPKILQIAKRYGDDGKNNRESLTDWIGAGYYTYETKETLSKQGKILIGWLFDDGCHPTIAVKNSFLINANSKNKEGAWEFLYFLLSEEVQAKIGISLYPVSKNAYDAIVEREIQEGALVTTTKDGNSSVRYKAGVAAYRELNKDDELYKELYNLTQEKADEIKMLLEDMHTTSFTTSPILEIIKEEASSYFAGAKTIEQIVPIIENRVQLYLDEKN